MQTWIFVCLNEKFIGNLWEISGEVYFAMLIFIAGFAKCLRFKSWKRFLFYTAQNILNWLSLTKELFIVPFTSIFAARVLNYYCHCYSQSELCTVWPTGFWSPFEKKRGPNYSAGEDQKNPLFLSRRSSYFFFQKIYFHYSSVKEKA
jgi:hypothetical protein